MIGRRLARIAAMVGALMAGYVLGLLIPWPVPPDVAAGELAIHERGSQPVVTMLDQERSDPFEFRYVLINGRGDWCVVVDREVGRVFICAVRYRARLIQYDSRGTPRVRVGGCAEVYSGVIVPRRR